MASVQDKSPQVDARVERQNDAATVRWSNGLTVRVVLDGQRVAGIGQVTCDDMSLRNPSRMWRPRIISPAGVHYHHFELRNIEVDHAGGVRLDMTAVGQATPFQEEQDEYLGDVVDLSLDDQPVRDRLVWEFRPSTLVIDGHRLKGLAYRYRFTSERHAIYRLLDHATWEPGGSLAGNTLLLQGQCNPPRVALSKEGSFTTACNYYGAEMKGITGIPERVSFQRLPRIGTVQAFDMIERAQGGFVGLFEPVEEVFSVVQTRDGEDHLHVVDEYRRPLSNDFQTPWKHVLWHNAVEGAWAAADRQNLWRGVYDHVHDAARSRHAITRSGVRPRVWLPQIGHDDAHILGRTVPREQFLYALADEAVPRWARMGVREICAFSLWQSDYTVDRHKSKQASHNPLHGALIVGSICNVHNHVIDPLWGGVEGLAYLVEKAHQHEMLVQLWFATHMSRRAPIFQQRPDFMLTARDGLPNGGGFGHESIVTFDLNNPDCFEHVFQNLKAVYDATGIDGFFHDSYGNMTFLPTNFADPRRQGQQLAYERLVVRLQQQGMSHFTIEGIGPFGVGHFGMSLLDQSGYQNALDWWIGHEDMIYGLNMGIEAPVWPQREDLARQFSFRCIAFGGRFGFTGRHQGIEHWDGWLSGHNQLLARFGPLLGRRIVLPDGRGVLWRQPDGSHVLFSFVTHQYNLDTAARVVGFDELAQQTFDEVTRTFTATAANVFHWHSEI